MLKLVYKGISFWFRSTDQAETWAALTLGCNQDDLIMERDGDEVIYRNAWDATGEVVYLYFESEVRSDCSS